MTIEILIYNAITILSIVVVVFFIIKNFIDKENKTLKMELSKRQSNTHIEITLPLRLQALERMALLLERLSPQNLILRLNNDSLTAKEFNMLLINEIKSEFSHNCAQQIYVSKKTWSEVKKSIEETIGIINFSMRNMDDNMPASELTKSILQDLIEKEADPMGIALEQVREDTIVLFK